MTKRRYRTTKPRVRLADNGRMLLAGLSYDDLRSIVTAASLHNYDSLKEAQAELDKVKEEITENPEYFLNDVKLANAQDNLAWLERRGWIIDTVHEAIKNAIQATFPNYRKPLSLKKRLLTNKKERESNKRIMDAGPNWLSQLLVEAEAQ